VQVHNMQTAFGDDKCGPAPRQIRIDRGTLRQERT
jgi:hypothetical protein